MWRRAGVGVQQEPGTWQEGGGQLQGGGRLIRLAGGLIQ